MIYAIKTHNTVNSRRKKTALARATLNYTKSYIKCSISSKLTTNSQPLHQMTSSLKPINKSSFPVSEPHALTHREPIKRSITQKPHFGAEQGLQFGGQPLTSHSSAIPIRNVRIVVRQKKIYTAVVE